MKASNMIEHINELKQYYGLADYHISFADIAQHKVGLRGKRVLEVGGSLPKEFVLNELNTDQWISIEKMNYWQELPNDTGKVQGTPPKEAPITVFSGIKHYDELGCYRVLSGGAEEIPISFYGNFDVVFSIAAFEHITMFPLGLDRMFNVLKPGGFLFSMWSPIWSAHDGHHLPPIVDKLGKEMSFGKSPIPPWGHLLMRPNELYQHIINHTDTDTAARIIYYVYNSPHINRLFVEDYIGFINISKFQSVEITGYACANIQPEIQKRLEVLYPKHRHFTNNGIMAVLIHP